jgi:peptide-methionine (S)-S-oxide reductase
MFWSAEDYHQKYRLRRNRGLLPYLKEELGQRWDEHSLSTKLNASGQKGFNEKPWLSILTKKAQRIYRVG